MKRFRVRSWDLVHLLSDGTPEDHKRLDDKVRKREGDLSRELEIKKTALESRVKAFQDKRSLLSKDISNDNFFSLLYNYAIISEDLEKLYAASYLKFCEDTSNETAISNNYDVKNFNTRMMNELLFFELWIRTGLDDANFERLFNELPQNEAGYQYRKFLIEERRFQDYTLDEKTERLINSVHAYKQTRSEAYETDISGLRFTISEYVWVKRKGGKGKKEVLRKKTLDETQLMEYQYHPTRKMRELAMKTLFKEYSKVKNKMTNFFIMHVNELKSEAAKREEKLAKIVEKADEAAEKLVKRAEEASKKVETDQTPDLVQRAEELAKKAEEAKKIVENKRAELAKGHYSSPLSALNHSNNIENAVVDFVLDASKENVTLFQDYFANTKRKLAGIRGKMSFTDIYAPVNGCKQKRISFTNGMNLVLEALNDFSTDFGEILIEMDKKGYIHSKPQRNKWIGTFSYPTPPSVLPYTLINFNNREIYCIKSLAHELPGHAVHNYLCSLRNNVLTYTPSDPVAEISSFFAEFLVFDKMLERAGDDTNTKKKLLSYFLDNAYEYTVKKAYTVMFEKETYDLIDTPGFEIKDISDLYLKKLKEQMGDVVHVQEFFKDEWMTSGNVMEAPFQDCSYTFGYIVAISLHEQYKKQGKEFADKITNILSAGNAPIEELLKKEVGFDIRSKEFWQHGYDLIKEKMEELKKMM